MEQSQESKLKSVLKKFMSHDILLSPDAVKELNSLSDEQLSLLLSKIESLPAAVLTSDIKKIVESSPNAADVNWIEFEHHRVNAEKNSDTEVYNRFLNILASEPEPSDNAPSSESGASKQHSSPSFKPGSEKPSPAGSVEVVFSYDKTVAKREVRDFSLYYNKRYQSLQHLLSSRQELQNVTSIARVLAKKDRENLSIIGIVSDISLSRNGNLMLTLEDPTGEIKVVVSKSKPELFKAARDIVLDEVIGVAGANGNRVVFATNIIWPDIPAMTEQKRSPDEAFAIFLSDIHVGSNNFLPDEFNRFLDWISGNAGSPSQREIASKVRYVFIAGDIVDGVGVYPGQESELVIPDIEKQYESAAELLSRIPSHIPLIICPGNHDAGRIAEPQLKLGTGFSKALSNLPNAVFVSNPAVVRIHSSPSFPGFNVLMYHGYSFDYFIANVDSIRTQGGYDRADLMMRFLLQRRHLAPTQGSTLYIPDPDMDPLVIQHVPDFFVSGHIHKCSVSNYKGTTLISGSCWQSTTDFQRKVGHHPEPARVPIVNLQTREVKILRF
ncbi:DNA-directed DNA polymerase II small subunit [Candidatus Woesearchaeota archaeon]|nr:MAG: DNA-directed DNA polymerase II small subunit [Candidatus Woesearchaeota archaeon]